MLGETQYSTYTVETESKRKGKRGEKVLTSLGFFKRHEKAFENEESSFFFCFVFSSSFCFFHRVNEIIIARVYSATQEIKVNKRFRAW